MFAVNFRVVVQFVTLSKAKGLNPRKILRFAQNDGQSVPPLIISVKFSDETDVSKSIGNVQLSNLWSAIWVQSPISG